MPFEKINPQTDFAKMEESILEFWKKENIFYRSVAEKNDTNRYFFYDGPPFATGLADCGHFLRSYFLILTLTCCSHVYKSKKNANKI